MRDGKKALPVDPNVAVATLEDALALWRGPALADLADQTSLLAEAARLDELRLEAQEARIEGLLAAGAPAAGDRGAGGARRATPAAGEPVGAADAGPLPDGAPGRGPERVPASPGGPGRRAGHRPLPGARAAPRARSCSRIRGSICRASRSAATGSWSRSATGGSGVVFRAIQPHVERDVAVKIVHEGSRPTPTFVRRFERDAQAVAALEHPHIAPIYDYWREPGRAYVVSRYLRGGSLRASRSEGSGWSASARLRVLEQISVALAFAHRQGVMHGNVGPSNVLFDARGQRLPRRTSRSGSARRRTRRRTFVRSRAWPSACCANETSLVRVAERAAAGQRLPDGGCARRGDPHGARTRCASPLRRRAGTPTRACGRSPRPTPATSSAAGELTRRLVAGSRETGPGRGSWPSSARAAAGSPRWSAPGSCRRSGEGALGRPEDRVRRRDAPRRAPDRRAGGGPPADRGATRRPACTIGSSGLARAARGRRSGAPGRAPRWCWWSTSSRRSSRSPPTSGSGSCSSRRSAWRPPTPRAGSAWSSPCGPTSTTAPSSTRASASCSPSGPRRCPAHARGARAGDPGAGRARSASDPSPGLVAEMIADVAHQPGALPLLQYALTELFERRDDDRLTLAAYREIGGVAGALSARAERMYESTGRRRADAPPGRCSCGWSPSARDGGHPAAGRSGASSTRSTSTGGDRRRHRHLRASPAAHVRPGTVHPGADRRDRPRGAAGRLGRLRDLDRRRPRGPPSGTRPGPGGRRVARIRRRPELPAARAPDWSSSRRGPRRRTWRSGDPSAGT